MERRIRTKTNVTERPGYTSRHASAPPIWKGDGLKCQIANADAASEISLLNIVL